MLYQRYHARIAAYVRGMVKDHARAEDVTQEVFFSALRRMRDTERPIAFKPWVYEIARNACIDSYRRTSRTDELSYDADGGLPANDTIRLVSPDQGPTRPWSPSRSSTTCAAPSAGSPRPTIRSSSCASSRACPTARSASAWA